ncbi:MAG: PAS domain-containing protein [Rhodospirillales bacterium]|nr:PAS domain-containing protein [Rhodospirillales bacterium]MBT5350759.1 PAS domain-containing protein [Rhodospirillales bacterium]MBT5521400.1 PAS domain-containing protein [Rhodospirillales bacterium]
MPRTRFIELTICFIAGSGLLLSSGVAFYGSTYFSTQVMDNLLVTTFICGVLLLGCHVRGVIVLARSDTEHLKKIEVHTERGNSLKAIFDNAPVEMYLKDSEGRYVQINRRFEELFNVTNEELKGQLPEYAHDSDLGERTRQHDLAVLKSGETVIREENAETAFGSRILNTIKFPVFDDDGTIRGLGAIVTDVTEIKRVENAFQENTQRLDSILQHAPVAIHLKDMDGRYLVINHAFEELFDCSSGNTLGHKFDEHSAGVLAVDGHSTIADIERKVIESGEPYRFEIEHEILNETRLLEAVKFPVLDGNGVVLGVGGIESDITERRRVNSRVNESEARLKALFDNASEGMFFKDVDGTYEMANKTFANRLGFDDVSQVVGKSAYDLFPAKDAEIYRLDDIACMNTRLVSSSELEIPLPDGSEMIQFAIKFPIISADGTVRGLGGIDIDITDRKNIERMKNEFIATMSHELRTPLTSIKGSLGLVVNGVLGDLPDEASDMVSIAYRNTNRLINLVNDVLDMEKIASGSMGYDFQRLNISKLVSEALKADQYLLEEYGDRRILTDIMGELPVSGDSTRLNQVIANLLSNAIKFSPEGGEIKVVVSRLNDDAYVAITDQGDGIPAIYHDQIFDRFTQVDSSDTRQSGGTGLGLNISKSIVEQHGGNIDFHSEVGEGSTFFFTLPVLND